MVTSWLSFDNELSPQEASVATLCQVLHRRWPDLFTITSTPRKFAECLYCDISPPPILYVLSRSIESPVICNLYDRSSHIHTFMHPHINTFIYSHIQAYTTHTYTHNINSHTIASVAHSLVWSYPINSIINCFKWSVLNNGQLEFTSCLCFMWLSPKKRKAWVYLFSFFQVVSPKQWTSWVKWSVLNNGQLKFTFRLSFKWSVLNNGQLESSGQS